VLLYRLRVTLLWIRISEVPDEDAFLLLEDKLALSEDGRDTEIGCELEQNGGLHLDSHLPTKPDVVRN
jgi:hypothetical protein